MDAGARRSPPRPRVPASRRAAPTASGTPLCVWVGRAGALGCALSLIAGMSLAWEGAAATRSFLLAGLFGIVWAAGALVALFSPYHPEIDGLPEPGRRESSDGSGGLFDGGGDCGGGGGD
jgi:hypothetical protein